MVSVSITIKDFDQTAAKLRALGEDLTDFTEVLAGTGKDLVDYFSTVPFKFHGNNYKNPWPDVTPSRLAYKVKNFPQNAHNTLIATGHMQKSFIYGATKNELVVGNTASYFAYHQLGLGGKGNFKFKSTKEQFKNINKETYIHSGYTAASNKRGYTTLHGEGLPQRIMMAVNGTVKDMIVRDIEKAIQAKIDKFK